MEGIIERELPGYQVNLIETLGDNNASRELSALQSGQIQFSLLEISTLQTIDSQFAVFSIPFMFRDDTTINQFGNSSQGKRLLSSLAGKGVLGLGYMYGGMKQLLSNIPIKEYSDLRQLNLSYPADNPTDRTTLQVKTTPVANGNLVEALKENRINAQEATYEQIYGNQLHLLYRYILESNHSARTFMLSANSNFWNALSDYDREVFLRATDVALKFGNQLVVAGETNSREQIRLEGGARKKRMSEVMRINWTKQLQPLWNNQANLIGQDLFGAAFDYSHQLHFYTENFPPYNFEENGELKGIAVDFLRLVYDQTKYRDMGLKIELKTWSYGYQAAQNGPNIVLFSTVRSPQREHLFKWAGPITSDQTVALKRKQDNISIFRAEDLNRYKVGVIRDDIGQQLAREQGVKPENMKVYSNADKLVSDLNNGYIDIWIYNLAGAYQFFKKFGYKSDDFTNIYKLSESPLYFAFSPDVDDRVVANIQAAIDDVKHTPEFEKIIQKYQ
ncbi:TRAP-type C4-dicarboxylate transport system, periplasmic component [Gynuella sunshinyii YC6258]|uniref:TRAP-type C4-dicarboxylate transport system, periplasmic component n=2 Tax=Gynuella sunshinyii TaxID=1445505 RepID=A0A0C5VJZ6_9GAMM|nr:TRAP-type C4-dicarboxylate transport system, periplasmic component [Gynuella sunshinyii YC6258]